MSAAIGAGVSWARPEAPSDVTLIDGGLCGEINSACKECALGSSKAALIDAVGIGGTKQGYVFESSCPIPAVLGVPVGK